MNNYTKYMIEYDVNLGQIWLSGLTEEKFWIDLEHIKVFDDPHEQAFEIAEKMRSDGLYVDVFDITDEEDEYTEEDEDEDES